MPNNTGPMTKDNMVELLPCPFCGATFAAVDPVHVCEFEIDYDDGVEPEHHYRWSVQCDNCTATTGNCASEDDATALWNTRATMHGSDSGALREALVDTHKVIREMRLADRHANLTGDEVRFDKAFAEVCKIEARLAALNLSSETGE